MTFCIHTSRKWWPPTGAFPAKSFGRKHPYADVGSPAPNMRALSNLAPSRGSISPRRGRSVSPSRNVSPGSSAHTGDGKRERCASKVVDAKTDDAAHTSEGQQPTIDHEHPGEIWRQTLTREFMTDLARLVEGVIMYDVSPQAWGVAAAAYNRSKQAERSSAETTGTAGNEPESSARREQSEEYSRKLAAGAMLSRQKSAPLIPTSLNGMKEKPERQASTCALRMQVAEWVAHLMAHYDAQLVEWIDSDSEQVRTCSAHTACCLRPALVA